MPPLETSSLLQKAVLWEVAGIDADGNHTVSSPVEIDCRWEDRKGQQIGPDGDSVSVDSRVFVERLIPEGSVLRLGELKELPSPLDNLAEVIGSNRIPDIKNVDRFYSVNMRRITKLPTIV